MRTPTLAALVAAALLAGCGGGGSSTPSTPPGSSSAQSGSLSTTDIAQDATSAGFDAVDTSEADASLANGSLGASSAFRTTRSTAFTCRHRRSRTVTTNTDGSTTVETIDYYDNACTQAERDAVAIFATTGGTSTVARTITSYSLIHAQLGVRQQNYVLTGTPSSGSWTVLSAFYPGTSTTALSQYSHSASINASTYAATTGHIFNDAKPSIAASYGHASVTNAAISNDSSGDTIFTGSRNGTFFKGAFGALSLSTSAPFTVSGGTQTGTAAFTGSVGFTSDGVLEAVSVGGTLPGGNTIAITSSTDSSGNVTVDGTVSGSAGTVATFVVDANGNGVLTIAATSTQVPIVDWHVVW